MADRLPPYLIPARRDALVNLMHSAFGAHGCGTDDPQFKELAADDPHFKKLAVQIAELLKLSRFDHRDLAIVDLRTLIEGSGGPRDLGTNEKKKLRCIMQELLSRSYSNRRQFPAQTKEEIDALSDAFSECHSAEQRTAMEAAIAKKGEVDVDPANYGFLTQYRPEANVNGDAIIFELSACERDRLSRLVQDGKFKECLQYLAELGCGRMSFKYNNFVVKWHGDAPNSWRELLYLFGSGMFYLCLPLFSSSLGRYQIPAGCSPSEVVHNPAMCVAAIPVQQNESHFLFPAWSGAIDAMRYAFEFCNGVTQGAAEKATANGGPAHAMVSPKSDRLVLLVNYGTGSLTDELLSKVGQRRQDVLIDLEVRAPPALPRLIGEGTCFKRYQHRGGGSIATLTCLRAPPCPKDASKLPPNVNISKTGRGSNKGHAKFRFKGEKHHLCVVALDAHGKLTSHEQIIKVRDVYSEICAGRTAAEIEEEKNKRKAERQAKPKKDPNAPKRPLTSFMIFSKERRPALQEEENAKPEDQRMTVSEYGKKLGELWRGLSAAERVSYGEKAKAAKAVYQEAMASYVVPPEYAKPNLKRATASSPKKPAKGIKRQRANASSSRAPPCPKAERQAKPKKDPNAPKKPLTSFVFFCKERRPALQEEENAKPEDQRMTFSEWGKKLGELWRDLSVEERVPYEDKAEAAKAVYQEAMASYVVPPEYAKPNLKRATASSPKKPAKGIKRQRANASSSRAPPSRFCGVSFNRVSQKWRAQITHGGRVKYIGEFADEKEAALAYDAKARELKGEGAVTNFDDVAAAAAVAATASSRRARRPAVSSRFRGVRFHRANQKWRAEISHGGRNYHLGYFADEKEAALAYDAKARELKGEGAVTNFDVAAAAAGSERRPPKKPLSSI